MNLIEQLGGYERAKDGLHRLKLEKKDLLTCGDLVVVESEIDAALLEYRRQHNIFEVGDKVVVLTNALGNKYTWIVESIDGIMVEISQVGQPNEWVHYSEIAHTTPEEIKAGRRL